MTRSDVTTVSVYDLLPEDERKAIAWVREHGGLDAVEKRIMPEGMEWPRFEDGEKLTLDNAPIGVEGVEFPLDASGYALCCGVGPKRFRFCERVERPEPKALDADGVEICVGDRLYDTDTGCGRTVRAVNDNGTVEFDGHENRGWFGCFLTHRAPVLAADGKPLEVGQTVWHVGNGVEFTVIGLPNPGEYQAVKLRLDDGAFTGLDPDQLTHQRPVLDADGVPIHEGDTVYGAVFGGPFTVTEVSDKGSVFVDAFPDTGMHGSMLTHTNPEPPDTWERIEEDAGCTATKYNERRGTIFTTKQQVARDLVRRCRALAERERGE